MGGKMQKNGEKMRHINILPSATLSSFESFLSSLLRLFFRVMQRTKKTFKLARIFEAQCFPLVTKQFSSFRKAWPKA